MFVLRISFFNGLAVAAAVTVLMVMCSALWMLPALLSLLGPSHLRPADAVGAEEGRDRRTAGPGRLAVVALRLAAAAGAASFRCCSRS